MGRGRVELKRIENKISRQVTFSKRRSGLWKKANEISVLCDSELALIVFSTNGKLFHYSSTHSSMERVLARYEQHIFSHKKTGTSDDQPKDNLLLDHPKLVARLELLQKHTRNYAGEDLDPLSLRELQSLEQQLDNSLKRIRTKRNQLMHESLSKLQKKERSLQDQNSSLKKQLKEKEKKRQELEGLANALTLPHTTLTIGEGAGSQHGSRDESESAFAQNDGTGDEDESNQSRSSGPNTLIPPWLLSHVKSPVTFRPH